MMKSFSKFLLIKLLTDSRSSCLTFPTFTTPISNPGRFMIATTVNDVSHLCELLKTKSQSAFEELYDRYSGALYGVIYKKVQNTGIAEEILQHVFIKAWKNIDNYNEHKETLFIWLLSITTGTCRNYKQTIQQQEPTNQ